MLVWDPGQYARFAAERRQPFDDLLAMVDPCPGGRVVDLGCGSGELTAELHRHCEATRTIGVDSSATMLEQASGQLLPGLEFQAGDLTTWPLAGPSGNEGIGDDGSVDVVFANASLQWAEDHPTLLTRLRSLLAGGGQLAFQVPANGDHPSHRVAAALVRRPPYLDALGGIPPRDPTSSVLAPEAYAELLDALGAEEQHVRLQIYGHHLSSTEDVVEWVQGTLLTPVRAGLDDDLWARFLEDYRSALIADLGRHRHYFYAYKRILVRARFR